MRGWSCKRILVCVGVVVACGVSAGVAAGAATSVPFVFSGSVPHVTSVPPGRVFMAAAAEPDGDHVVLYGGQDPGSATNPAFGDTWIFDGAHGWVAKCGTTTPATMACPPGVRTAAGLGTGPHGVVLFGGFAGSLGGASSEGDTWLWNGNTWTQLCTSASCGPGPRAAFAMAGNGTQVVMFGGLTSTGQVNDTWVFDGTTWTQTCGAPLATACGPAPLAAASMAWDGTHFVMFGGADVSGSGAPVDDTWIFNGTSWTKACGSSNGGTACGPPGRAFAAFSYAPHTNQALRGAVLMVGGNLFASSGNLTAYRDAWLWHDTKWTKLAPPWAGPPVTWTNAGSPPAGSAPLLGVAAPRATQCQIVFLGESVAISGVNPVVHSRTYIGGRDLTGDAQPDACTAAIPTITAPPTSPPPPTPPLPAATELPRTGTTTIPLAGIGLTALCAGLVIITRRRSGPTGMTKHTG